MNIDDGSLWLLIPLIILAVAALWTAVKIDERKHGPAPLQDPTDSIVATFKMLFFRKRK